MRTHETTVLVTGGAGFIGSALIRQLKPFGASVIVLDDLSSGRLENLPPGWAQDDIVLENVLDVERLAELIDQRAVSEIYHLAAIAFVPECEARPCAAVRTNVEGTAAVLSAATAAGVERIFYASSAAVYAPSSQNHTEDHATGPVDIYGQTKVFGEALVRMWGERSGGAAVIGRFSNAIGPRESKPFVIPHIIRSMRTSDVIRLGNLSAVRDYIHVDDLCRGVIAAMGCLRGCGVTVYNIGSGTGVSVREVLDIIARMTGRPITAQVEQSRLRTNDRARMVISSDKLTAATGWSPQVLLEEALQELVQLERLA